MPAPALIHKWQVLESFSLPTSSLNEEAITIESSPSKTLTIELFDCYKQKLRNAGLALYRSKNRFTLASSRDLETGAIVHQRSLRKKVITWQHFDEGDLRNQLKKLLKLRAATPKLRLKRRLRTHSLENQKGDTVATLEERRYSNATSGSSISLLALHATPGLEEQAQRLAAILEKSLKLQPAPASLLDWACETAGLGASPLTPLQALKLDPADSVQKSVSTIAKLMVEAARETEEGIIADVDTEHLHDYRVSLRKLRSVLSLIKGAYAQDETRRLKELIGNLAKSTNRLRDLDVYLLEADTYRSLLPDSLQPGLKSMFRDFKSERNKELQSIQRHLQSKTYRDAMESLSQSFTRNDMPKGKQSDFPIGLVAAKEILLHHKRISKMGSALNAQTPDKKVHKLRIECKKLRYLLEVFESLFPADAIKTITQQLKGLQNVLGLFNDYCVQQASLAHYLSKAKRIDRKASAAIGGLITSLHQAQLETRKHVSENFIQFNNKPTKRLFKTVFAQKEAR
ncbi:CHAD domain family [Verrucomicrobiia bacterium DG1235]|nr:CHAD domain family [Verrucomicrobiae bacterium DG1235]